MLDVVWSDTFSGTKLLKTVQMGDLLDSVWMENTMQAQCLDCVAGDQMGH